MLHHPFNPDLRVQTANFGQDRPRLVHLAGRPRRRRPSSYKRKTCVGPSRLPCDFDSNRMDAAIELWPFSSAWETAEIAVAARRYAHAPLKTLMQLVAEEAAPRRFARLVALVDGDPDSLPLLASIGEVELDGETARIDISILTAPFSGRTLGYDVRADETSGLRCSFASKQTFARYPCAGSARNISY